jgi:hypothetical protein
MVHNSIILNYQNIVIILLFLKFYYPFLYNNITSIFIIYYKNYKINLIINLILQYNKFDIIFHDKFDIK